MILLLKVVHWLGVRDQVPTPSPSTIFIRDKAILVNLESLRMIVCYDKARLPAVYLSTLSRSVRLKPALPSDTFL